MNRVLISVEGQTEETFVRDVLAPHLWNRNVDLTPVVLMTKRVKQGNKFKGGITSYQKAENDIVKLLKDSNAVAVTTMYDLYALPNDFPDFATHPLGSGFAKASYLEDAFKRKINHRRFYPYLQLHEFEALLFAAPQQIAAQFPGTRKLDDLQRIRARFNSPEEINDGPETAPSKRILKLFESYDKPADGVGIIKRITLEVLRRECAHFAGWVEWLEGLG